ncbi:MAG: PAS domain S-box protein [Anaerolineae bacterium]|nr:PAS domain S-box protein [Anaerolineae bacterium]
MTDSTKTKAQLESELAALRQRVVELETEQRQREAELEYWLAAERENWALAEALTQTGAAISSSLRGEEVLDRILEEMSRVVACDAACLLLIEGDVARVYRWRGYIRSGWATPYEIVSAALPVDNFPTLRSVRQTNRPLAVSYPAGDEAWVNKFGLAWVKSYACAPIRNQGRVVGFLVVDSETPGFFEPADTEPLQAFADQAAIALENVGLHNRVRGEIVKRLKMLKKERNFISAILDTADALVVALNRSGQIVHFNRACEQTSGYSFAEVKNHYVWELLPPETAASTQSYFTDIPPGPFTEGSHEVPRRFEAHLITKTGQQRLIAWSTSTLFDRSGLVEYVIATGIDITEQKRAETALRESEERFRILFEFAPDAYYLNDLEGRFIDGNRAAEEIIGYPKETLIGRSFSELGLLSPHELPKALAALAQNRRGESSGPDEFTLNRQDGSPVTVEIRSFPIEIKGQRVVLGLARDITQRKQAEAALQYSEATQRAILDAIPDFMFRLSRDGVYIPFHTPRQAALLYPDESRNKKVTEVLPQHLAQKIMERLEQSFQTGEMQIFEYSLAGPGEIRHYEARMINSGLDEILCILRDITDRKQAEEILRQSEATKRAILAAIPDLMFRLSREGIYLDLNAPHPADLILPPEDVLGRNLAEVLPLEVAGQFLQAIEHVCQTGETQTFDYEMSIRGQNKYFEARLVWNGPDEVLAIVRNITDRKKADEALRLSEQRLELALTGADLGSWDLNLQTGRDITNQRAVEMLGYTLDEVETQIDWWDERTHPEDKERLSLAWEAHLIGKSPFYECEYRLQTKSGEWKWILDRGKVVQRDEAGRPIRLAGTHLDITERKQAEEALRAQNEQLQARNKELDAFAHTVAHDLKNPLGVLTNIAEILLEDYPHMPSDRLAEYLRSIAQSGRRANRIVEALLLLAGVRQQIVNLQPLDMSSIVAEALQRLSPMMTQYQAEVTTPTTWPTALGFAPWIEEVWVNYLSNGLKYGGSPPHLELGAAIQENGMIRFWVKDNGTGLSPEAQAKLFMEFTQLEPDRMEGHGLGLSIVRRIVEKLGGQIGVESEGKAGRGSTFSFTLPPAPLPPAD